MSVCESTGSSLSAALMRPRRNYLCHLLPEGFVPPVETASREALTRAVCDALGVPALSPVIREMAPGVWLLAFLHGAARERRMATYDGRPGAVWYRPRLTAMAVVDGRHGLLYATAPRLESVQEFLLAFNGTLFPGRRPAAPFITLTPDLERFALLGPEERRPRRDNAPWKELQLKALSWEEAGLDGALGERKWPLDGYDAPDPWPEHVRSVVFKVTPQGSAPFVVEVQRDGGVRAMLSARTLGALAGFHEGAHVGRPQH